ncbi:TonB-dependent receptor [Mucilaginibacter sp. SMC90]|uniref:TonB-dependent siderophore receptor n=1 Tax=Mucilaginibacter sp. SMC90 TaxID=2929803 RepID=UPI001FB3F2FB|nr:TonB-dependent siderophore receptor [Mucilaginibacter sp. SMC90]UOE46507.1 TonB-dependent receptor [Mucilaginibacter sp. SMC90]
MKHSFIRHSLPYFNSSVISKFLIGLLFFILPGLSFAQQASLLDKKIDLRVNNASIDEALTTLGKSAGCTFSYSNTQLNVSKPLNADFKQLTVKEILHRLLGNDIRLQVSGNQVFIQSGAARGTVKGTVKTSDGQPAEYVTVTVKGISAAAVDKNGHFVLRNIPAGSQTVTASFIGLIPQTAQVEVKNDGETSLNFNLQEDRQTLQEVVIKSNKSKRGYTVPLSAIGSKFPVALKDIPNSVSVITRQLMDDANMNTLTDALNQTTGITATPYGDGTSYFQSRGYSSDIQYDGLPTNNGVQYLPQFDLNMYDRVEVLRGPSGLLQGSSSAAGVINLVRKRPLDSLGIAGSVSAGSWNNFRANLDFSTPFDKAGKLKGRFVLSGDDRDYFIDKTHSKHGLGYAILEYQPDSKTSFTISGTLQGEKMAPFDYGAGVYTNGQFLNAPRNTFFGTDWSTSNTTTKELYAEAKRQLGGDWQAKITFDYRNVKTDGNYGYVDYLVNLDNTADYAAQGQHFTVRWAGIDANVTGSYNLFGRKQQLVAGINYAAREQLNESSYKGYSGVNVYDINVPFEQLTFDYGAKNNSKQYGIYAQTRVKVLEPLTVVLGGRVGNYENKNQTVIPTTGDWQADPKVKGQFTPYAGLVYAVTQQVSLHTSYSNVFAAQAQATQSGASLTPEKGNQFEGGVKGAFFNGQLNASIAGFLIHDENRAIQDPAAPTFYVANGKVRSRGIEAEVSGTIARGLNVVTGYTYLETKYITDPTNQGDIFNAEIPKNTFKLWATYTLQEGLLKNLRFGLGGRAVSSANRGAQEQKGYALVNAQAGYTFARQWSASVTVNNLFDKVYYARIPSSYYGLYGDPRNAMLTIRKSF